MGLQGRDVTSADASSVGRIATIRWYDLLLFERVRAVYDIFLSYRRSSGLEFCSFLFDVLTDAGYCVFFDYDSLRQGDFEQQIDKAIRECTSMLVLLAPHDLDACLEAPEKDWILHEVSLAFDCKKQVIPVCIKEGFSFPASFGGNSTLEALSRQQICDVHGSNAAQLVKTRLFEFIEDSGYARLAEEYYNGILQSDYRRWEIESLQNIYCDCSLVHEFGCTYASLVYEGSPKVTYPFKELNLPENLREIEDELGYEDLPLYNVFRRIVEPTVHFPDLYGFTNKGILFDDSERVEGFVAQPRTFKETLYTGHILQFELWNAYKRNGSKRLATLDDLPIRSAFHKGQTPIEALLSGSHRSSLCGIDLATIVINERTGDYEIAVATRSKEVACFPGYLSLVPTGGFELYELERNQSPTVVKQNFSILAAVLREYVEELFGEECFDEPTGDDDLNRLYRSRHVRDLRRSMGKSYHLEFLGVDMELISMRPMFAFVLRIDDPDFLYDNDIRKNRESVDIRFVPLKDFEDYVREREKTSPVMAESAAVYSLLKRNHLYQEAILA